MYRLSEEMQTRVLQTWCSLATTITTLLATAVASLATTGAVTRLLRGDACKTSPRAIPSHTGSRSSLRGAGGSSELLQALGGGGNGVQCLLVGLDLQLQGAVQSIVQDAGLSNDSLQLLVQLCLVLLKGRPLAWSNAVRFKLSVKEVQTCCPLMGGLTGFWQTGPMLLTTNMIVDSLTRRGKSVTSQG